MYGPRKEEKKKKHHDWDRDLSTDLDRIRNVFGCDVLVSLIRHSELQDLKIQQLFQEVEARGMDYIHFPIKDKWIPHSMDDLIKNIDHIIQLLKKGKTVVCHCNGGKGRSGTVIVATLVGLGHKVQNAIDIVRKARSGTIRNPLQIMYVKRFKNAWLQYVKKKFDDGTEGLGTISEEEVEDIPDVEGGLADKEGLSEKVTKRHSGSTYISVFGRIEKLGHWVCSLMISSLHSRLLRSHLVNINLCLPNH